MATSVVKTYTTSAAGVGELNKSLNITRGLASQQLLLFRQQQPGTTVPSTLSVQPLATAQSQSAVVTQKLSLPSGIEQLRATVASAASVLPRFPGIAANSGGTVKSLSSGRTLQTEEVLALFKQQSMRIAATQSAQLSTKSSQVPSHQAGLKLTTTSAAGGVGQQQGSTTGQQQGTAAQNFKAQIQALATQHKSVVQTKLPLEKKQQ